MLAVSKLAYAGLISSWNTDNVDLAVGPFIPGKEYNNVVYQDNFKNFVRGGVVWTQSDVRSPGIKIVNGDDINSSNCIIAAGINPFDDSAKQCSDRVGSNKSFVLRADVVDNKGADLVFNVSASTKTSTYQVYQILTNNSLRRIDKFRIRLGFGVGGGFAMSSSGDQLAFALANGTPMNATYYVADPFEPDNLSGMFPFYLFGNNKKDTQYLSSGFFDDTAKAGFVTMKGKEDELQFNTLSTNYTGIFGRWLSLAEVPYGYFYDDDDNKNTQDLVVGYWDGTVWRDTNGLTIDKEMITSWELDTGYTIRRIKGLASYNYRFNINVGQIESWPTYNSTSKTATFTVNTIPSYGAASTVTWLNPKPPLPAPLAANDQYKLAGNLKQLDISDPELGLLANDRSRTSGLLSASLVAEPNFGSVRVDAGGTFLYTANATFVREDSFTYLVNDGFQDSSPATVTIKAAAPAGCAPAQQRLSSHDPTFPILLIGAVALAFRRKSGNNRS